MRVIYINGLGYTPNDSVVKFLQTRFDNVLWIRNISIPYDRLNIYMNELIFRLFFGSFNSITSSDRTVNDVIPHNISEYKDDLEKMAFIYINKFLDLIQTSDEPTVIIAHSHGGMIVNQTIPFIPSAYRDKLTFHIFGSPIFISNGEFTIFQYTNPLDQFALIFEMNKDLVKKTYLLGREHSDSIYISDWYNQVWNRPSHRPDV